MVLAIARPTKITAVESQRKKCNFITETAEVLGLENVAVYCMRAEDYGRAEGREAHDVVLSRALASLAVVAEYSLPLLSTGGSMVAMKGDISTQERIQAQEALDILGGGPLESIRLDPFPGALNRWVHIARKIRVTPTEYPAGSAFRRRDHWVREVHGSKAPWYRAPTSECCPGARGVTAGDIRRIGL